MKKLVCICLLTTLAALYAGAQNDRRERQREDRHIMDLFYMHRELVEEKTIDKVANIKTLEGQVISLRPDNDYGKTFREFKFVTTKTNILTNNSTYDKSSVTSDDNLLVVKAKKDELTLMLGEKKVTLRKDDFGRFMLRSDLDSFTQSFLQEEENARQEGIRLKQEAQEQAAREKAEAEEKQKEDNLKSYFAAVAQFNEREDGPIVINEERAYNGTSPYWKWQYVKGSNKIETYRDEKFVLSPHRFVQTYEGIRKKLERDPNNRDLKQYAKLETMQQDTFGIVNGHTLINLRTGDVFSNIREPENLKMWESINYLKNLAAQEKYVYDGKVSLQHALGGTDTPYRERIFEALVGERVFLLDSMKYDVITGFDEHTYNADYTTLFLQKRGAYQNWTRSCISVKWFEQLKQMVGKKALEGSTFTYVLEGDRLWKEDIKKYEGINIDAVEVKDHDLLVTFTDSWGTNTKRALDCCNLLACPINYTEEKEKRKAREKHLELHHEYVSLDAALATMPAKTQEVKKKEADDRAHWAESSRRIDKLRQHKLIGTSLDDFLKEYSGARLINTTSNGGVTVKVYVYLDYKLVFQNGKCVSQTTL